MKDCVQLSPIFDWKRSLPQPGFHPGKASSAGQLFAYSALGLLQQKEVSHRIISEGVKIAIAIFKMGKSTGLNNFPQASVS